MNARLQRGIDDIAKWANKAHNKTLLLDKSLEEIHADLAETTLEAARGIASSLDFMSTWHAIRGANDVLNNDMTGWHDIGRAYREGSLSAEMFMRAFHQDPRSRRRKKGASVLQDTAIENIAYGLMLGDEGVCSWLGGDLTARVEEGSILECPNTPFREFIVTLWQIYRAASLDNVCVDKAELGPYGDVFAAWTDEQGLGHVLEHLCEYHLEMSVDKGDDIDHDLLNEPLTVLPVEVHALRTVRARLHLPMPFVQHELMQTPLGKPPTDIEIPQDPLLKTVETWISEHLDS
jgi:hypothetical protein